MRLQSAAAFKINKISFNHPGDFRVRAFSRLAPRRRGRVSPSSSHSSFSRKVHNSPSSSVCNSAPSKVPHRQSGVVQSLRNSFLLIGRDRVFSTLQYPANPCPVQPVFSWPEEFCRKQSAREFFRPPAPILPWQILF